MATTKFSLLNEFLEYRSKPSPDNTDERFLVAGSQNVLIDDQNMVRARSGYSILGATSSSVSPIVSEFTWNDSSANETMLRSSGTILEGYFGTVEGTAFNSWETVEDSFTSGAKMNFAPWWSSTETLDILLFVDGETDNLYEWSGARTTIASVAAATITKNGSGTWASVRFLTAGTRQVRIKDTGGTWRTFTYTGGEATTTLTGVTPDPTAFTFSATALCVQEVRANDNTPASGYTNDFIRVLNNQAFIGSAAQRTVRVSKNTSITDYTFSTPRTQGEGATLTLDGEITGLGALQEHMAIFAGKDLIYRTDFVLLDSTGLKETLGVKKLKTGKNQGAFSQDFVAEVGNGLAYLGNDKKLYLLEDIGNVENPFLQDVSDPIKTDFDAATFTNGCMRFHGQRLILTAPADGNMWILETRKDAQGNLKRFWQPPQLFPFRQLSVYQGNLHGHSSTTVESFQLFTGLNDDNNIFESKAVFAYRNFGDAEKLKIFDTYYSELYASTSTKITLKIDYDYKGATSISEDEIDASDANLQFAPADDTSLGVVSLGTQPIGGALEALDDLVKIRKEYTTRPVAFHEVRVTYSSTSIDQQWRLLRTGPNVRLSPNQPFYLRR